MIPQIISSTEINELVISNPLVNPKHIRLVTDEKLNPYLLVPSTNSSLAYPLTPDLEKHPPREVRGPVSPSCISLKAGSLTYLICKNGNQVRVVNPLGIEISSYQLRLRGKWRYSCGEKLCVIKECKNSLALTPYA
ncbi:MAG: hypothetical protein J7L55_00750, partial [Desulfurococcales archaeon]|nr:hypothetical protein [Desulfurococcales archaeon]